MLLIKCYKKPVISFTSSFFLLHTTVNMHCAVMLLKFDEKKKNDLNKNRC